jgi:hypothetical protein
VWPTEFNVVPGRFRPELDGGVTGMTDPVLPAVVSVPECWHAPSARQAQTAKTHDFIAQSPITAGIRVVLPTQRSGRLTAVAWDAIGPCPALSHAPTLA